MNHILYAVRRVIPQASSRNPCLSSARGFLTMGSPLGISTVRPVHPALFAQSRNFGVTESIMNTVSGRMDKKKEAQFGEMLKQMADAPKWTLRNWKVTMDSQLDSWTQYIPGVSSSDEMVQLKGFKSMLDAMTDKELDSPALIKHPQKERIARASGKPVHQVQTLLHYYSQSCIIAEWLQMKKKANEKLPESETELNEMQAKDPRMKGIAQKVMKGNTKRTGRGRRAFF